MAPVLIIDQPVEGCEQFQWMRSVAVQWPQPPLIGKTCHTPSGVCRAYKAAASSRPVASAAAVAAAAMSNGSCQISSEKTEGGR